VYFEKVALQDAVDFLFDVVAEQGGWEPPAAVNEDSSETLRRVPPSTRPTPQLPIGFYIDGPGLRAVGSGLDDRLTFHGKGPICVEQALAGALGALAGAKEPVRCEIIGDIAFISTEKRLAIFRRLHVLDQRQQEPHGMRASLDRRLPELRFDKVGFSDVIDFLRDVTGRHIDVNWKQLEAAGLDRNTPIGSRLQDISMRQVLRLVLIEAAEDGPPIEMNVDPQDGFIDIGRSPRPLP
jgi:hypothetical protein